MQSLSTYKPTRFFLITFAITWTAWFIAAYFSYKPDTKGIQLLFMILGLCGPSIATLAMLAGSENKELRKDFLQRLCSLKIKVHFLPVLLVLVPCTLFLATTLSWLFGHSASQFHLTHQYTVMKGQNVIGIFISLFLAPTLEEVGWRGYAVDSLTSKYNLWNASLLFASLWALWHLPLFFIHDYYHHELWHTNIIYVLNFFASIFPAAILINWLYYKNNRSIYAAIAFHCMLNMFSTLFQTEQFTKCIMTSLLLVVAAIVVIRNKEFFFNQEVSL